MFEVSLSLRSPCQVCTVIEISEALFNSQWMVELVQVALLHAGR